MRQLARVTMTMRDLDRLKCISHDAHRLIRTDEDLDSIFAWRKLRKVTQNLTLHYERKLYLLADTAENRRLIGKYIDVFQFPDGRIEVRAAGTALTYSTYDKLGEIDQGAVVESKRLGHVLRIAQLVQSERDHRGISRPSTAHRANGMQVTHHRLPGTKSQRELSPADLNKAIALAALREPEIVTPAAKGGLGN